MSQTLLHCQCCSCWVVKTLCVILINAYFLWNIAFDGEENWMHDDQIVKFVRALGNLQQGFRGVVELLKDQKGGSRSKMIVLLAVVEVSGILCETNVRSLDSTTVQLLQKCCGAWRSRIGNRYKSRRQGSYANDDKHQRI